MAYAIRRLRARSCNSPPAPEPFVRMATFLRASRRAMSHHSPSRASRDAPRRSAHPAGMARLHRGRRRSGPTPDGLRPVHSTRRGPMTRKVIACSLLMDALLAPLAHAATTGTSTVTLAASAVAMIQITDASITLTPNATDYTNDYVEATGAAGIDVQVKTNSTGGRAL